MIQDRPIKIYLIAGEPSGDLLGARLIAAMRALAGGNIEFRGVGGDAMLAQGLESQFPMQEISLMGFLEIIPHIPNLRRRIRYTINDIQNYAPDVLITIDSPGFCKRVAGGVGRGKFPLVHYVAPSVWAWRSGRAKTMAKLFDHVLCLLPFEPPYFTAEGMKATFIGHSVVESDLAHGNAVQFRARHNIAPDKSILCLLPGSRVGEIKKLLPLFLQTYDRLRHDNPQLCAVIPTLPHLTQLVRSMCAAYPEILISDNFAEKKNIFAASNAALAASGTVSVELAMAGVPHVVAYRVNAFTAFIARRLIKTRYVSLVNIVMDQLIVPEFLQQSATSPTMANAVAPLLSLENRDRHTQISQLAMAIKKLHPPSDQNPSELAADAVFAALKSFSISR